MLLPTKKAAAKEEKGKNSAVSQEIFCLPSVVRDRFLLPSRCGGQVSALPSKVLRRSAAAEESHTQQSGSEISVIE